MKDRRKSLGYVVVLFSVILGAIYGCGSKSESNRSRQGKEPTYGDAKKDENLDRRDGSDGKQTSPGGSSSLETDPEENIDETTLPKYLFTKSDFGKIGRIVDPYRPVAFAAIPSMRNSTSLVRFIETTVNKAMQMPVHAPGRQFKVSVVNDNTMNAFMTGDSKLGLHLPTVLKTDENELLAVICHEMAHSAKNHVYKDAIEPELRIPNKLATQVKGYLSAQFDQNRGVYTHSEKEYREIKKAWDEAFEAAAITSKRAESEADLVGAKICGNMGMEATNYHKSLTAFLKRASGGSQVTKFKDGDAFKNVTRKSLLQVLFPIAEHPTPQERDQQIGRLKSLLRVDGTDQDKKLYREWQDGLNAPLSELKSSGFSLTDFGSSNIVQNEKTGEFIEFNPDHSGCFHGLSQAYDEFLED